jgi:hypothetical protein
MVTGPEGYEPRLEVHLDTVSVTSSLNDIKLIAAESCRVRIYHIPCIYAEHYSGPCVISITACVEC